MHHATHLRRRQENAFADAFYAQETVAGAIRADSALDNRTRSE
jgi:hypothetical protein